MTNYKNILVIKLGALGDWIHMTGFYSAIRHQWPKAKITLMTARSFFKMAQKSGYFDEYIEDNRTWNPLDYLRIVKAMVSNHYDLIIDLQMQSRTKKRYYPLTRLFTKHAFCWAYPYQGSFWARYIAAKPRLLWGKEKFEKMDFKPESASLSFCKADPKVLVQLPSKYVLLIPGCSPAHPYKRWPAEFYRQLALKLGKEKIYSVVLGTNAEKQEIDTICKGNSHAINFCNKSALLDIPEIAEKSLAIIGNDTGPQHMAELGTTPAITLFSEITASSRVIRNNVTNLLAKEIKDISVETVYQTLQSLWHKA